ncbi:MAG: type II toxin-antitoxin system VapC family toxin [Bradyrhizobiaceae bacterium]|nr:type II toxin-antitoxin system VapC family toxin [Bradyrhizobiaceae bacterium]
MSFLLDTNVVSEWVKPRPDPGLIEWLASVDEDRVYISVITISEIRYGIERMPFGARRKRIQDWFVTDLPRRFDKRILSINIIVADAWGRIMNRARAAGRQIGPMDAFIASTAQTSELTLVTRNVSDFEFLGVQVIRPWTTA